MFDYHVHTSFSADSATPMAAQVEAAIAAGLREIAFTEHEDYNPGDETSFFFRHADYHAEVDRCQAQYGDRIRILRGIEVSEPHRTAPLCGPVLAGYPWDFVLGSLHWVDGQYNAYLKDYYLRFGDWRESMRRYFRELSDLARGGDFDVMSHLDYPVRYGVQVFGDAYDIADFEREIRPALRILADRGKGMEINTNPLWRHKAHPNPPGIAVRWFREEGGEVLTVGSDSHRPATTGACIDQAIVLARAAGFTRLATFNKRKVTFVDLPPNAKPAA